MTVSFGKFPRYSIYLFLSLSLIMIGAFTKYGKSSFYVLFFISIVFLVLNFKKIKCSDKDVKYILIALFAWFLWTVFTNLMNGIPELTHRSLWGRQAFIISIIPLFFLFKKYTPSERLIFVVICIASVVMFGMAIYQIHYLGMNRAKGGEHHIQFGSIAMLLLAYIVSIGFFGNKENRRRYLMLIPMALLFVCIILSTSRGLWLTLPVLLVIWVKYMPYKVSNKNKILILLVALMSLSATYFIPSVTQRVDKAVSEVVNYKSSSSDRLDRARSTSSGSRFEMWKSAWYIFYNNPVLGVGLGGFKAAAKKYESQYLYNPSAYYGYHPHNQYFSELASKGFFGLILFVSFLFLMYKFSYKKLQSSVRSNKVNGFFGVQATAAISILCLTNGTFEAKSMVITMALLFSVMLASAKSPTDK